MLTTERDGNLLSIKLDDQKANVLTTQVLHKLREAIEMGRGADAVLISGREKVLSGGLDLREMLALEPDALHGFLELFHDTFRALFALERPLIIAGGGALLILLAEVIRGRTLRSRAVVRGVGRRP